MFAWIPICSYQSRTYVEVIEAVQRDALDSMGTLFAHTGEGSERYDIAALDMHPSMRLRISHYLEARSSPYLG